MRLYETERFYLRPFAKDLVDDNYKNWWTDQAVTRFNSHGLFPLNSTELEEFLNSLESSSKIVWAIIIKGEQRLTKEDCTEGYKYQSGDIHIGNISLDRIDWVNRSAEFSVVIGERDYWGQGYTTEAAKFLFEHGFNKFNLGRIWTGTAASNVGMRRVAEKLGMHEEGRFKSAVFLEGEYVDVVEFGLLREEWNQKRRDKLWT